MCSLFANQAVEKLDKIRGMTGAQFVLGYDMDGGAPSHTSPPKESSKASIADPALSPKDEEVHGT